MLCGCTASLALKLPLLRVGYFSKVDTMGVSRCLSIGDFCHLVPRNLRRLWAAIWFRYMVTCSTFIIVYNPKEVFKKKHLASPHHSCRSLLFGMFWGVLFPSPFIWIHVWHSSPLIDWGYEGCYKGNQKEGKGCLAKTCQTLDGYQRIPMNLLLHLGSIPFPRLRVYLLQHLADTLTLVQKVSDRLRCQRKISNITGMICVWSWCSGSVCPPYFLASVVTWVRAWV